MVEAIQRGYEESSEGAVQHWPIPYARLEDATPTPTYPAAVLSVLPGTQLTGTILVVDATDSVAIIDTTPNMIYKQYVRNVLTYKVGAEETFGAINIGDPIYYDRSATMPANAKLSTSPLDSTGAANPLFGFVVPSMGESDSAAALAAAFPKGAATASTQYCAVMQVGAGR